MIQSQALPHSNENSVLLNNKQMCWLKTALRYHLTRRFPFCFFIQAGVFGVALLEYLPEKNEPPFLVCVPPRGAATVATLPELVAPADAFSTTNSLALIQNP